MRYMMSLVCGLLLMLGATVANASPEDVMKTRTLTQAINFTFAGNITLPISIKPLLSELEGTPRFLSFDIAAVTSRPETWNVAFGGKVFSLVEMASITEDSLTREAWDGIFASGKVALSFFGAGTPITLKNISVTLNYAATPIPAAVWLLGTGIAGMAALQRRRAKAA